MTEFNWGEESSSVFLDIDSAYDNIIPETLLFVILEIGVSPLHSFGSVWSSPLQVFVAEGSGLHLGLPLL